MEKKRTKEKINFIKENIAKYKTRKELLEVLNEKFGTSYTLSCLYDAIRDNHLSIIKQTRWSEKEIEWIKSNYHQKSKGDEFEALSDFVIRFNDYFKSDRSQKSIESKLRKLKIVSGYGLKETYNAYSKKREKQYKRKFDNAYGDFDFFIENKEKYTITELCKLYEEKTGVPIKPNTLQSRFQRANISKPLTHRNSRANEKGTLKKYKRRGRKDGWMYIYYYGRAKSSTIPKSIYENSLIVPNCAEAYITLRKVNKLVK